jgi:PIN domain nuclease of toxin-antitoxin system
METKVNYLLDTMIWLWSVDSVEKLNQECRDILENGREVIYFSAATAWEISIKARLGKLHLPGPPAQVIPAFMAKQGLRPLPVTHLHAVKLYVSRCTIMIPLIDSLMLRRFRKRWQC